MELRGLTHLTFFALLSVTCFAQNYPQPADYNSQALYGWNESEQTWDSSHYTIVRRGPTIDRLKTIFRRTPDDGRWYKQQLVKEYGAFDRPDSSAMFSLTNRDTFLLVRRSTRYDEHQNIIERVETRQHDYQLSPMSRWKYVNEYEGENFVRGDLFFDLKAPFDDFFKIGETVVTYDSSMRQDSMFVYRRPMEDSTANLSLYLINYRRYYQDGTLKRACNSYDTGATFHCTHYSYDSLQRISEVIDSIDTRPQSLTTYTYEGGFEYPSQINGFYYDQMDSLWLQSLIRDYWYDQEGRLTELILTQWDHWDLELKPSRRYTYEYQKDTLPLLTYESEAVPYKFFPNPSSGKVEIQPTRSDEDYEVVVLDMMGKTQHEQILQGHQTIDLSHLSKGLYVIHYEQGGIRYSDRLILQ